MTTQVLHNGRFLRLSSVSGWEFVERNGSSGVVAIVAVTGDQRLVLVEQFRPPVGRIVVEIPAGLSGDIAGKELEPLAVAAHRELLEETGYSAGELRGIGSGPSSAGLTNEIITFFKAERLERIGAGGGDESEAITVHEIPLGELRGWLAGQTAAGHLIDPKIFAGLAMAGIRV